MSSPHRFARKSGQAKTDSQCCPKGKRWSSNRRNRRLQSGKRTIGSVCQNWSLGGHRSAVAASNVGIVTGKEWPVLALVTARPDVAPAVTPDPVQAGAPSPVIGELRWHL